MDGPCLDGRGSREDTLRGLQARMLIIDDDVATLARMAERFDRAGFRVETASHAGDALIILAESRPDLVLLAVSGPADLDALRCVRTVDPVVPVVLLTEGSDPALARGLGVLGSIPKSVVQGRTDGLETPVEGALEALEPGLRIVDCHFRIDHSTVDLLALDARDSLVLIAVGPSADARMFLRTLHAYTWCREEPGVVRKLFPAARVSPEQPPRLLFAAERFTPFFLQGLEALRDADVRCLQLPGLEAGGLAVVPLDRRPVQCGR